MSLALLFACLGAPAATDFPTCCHSDNWAIGCDYNWVVGANGQSCSDACAANGAACHTSWNSKVGKHESTVWPYEECGAKEELIDECGDYMGVRGVAPLQGIVCNFGLTCEQVHWDPDQSEDERALNPSYKDGVCYGPWFEFKPEDDAQKEEWCTISTAFQYPDSNGFNSALFSGIPDQSCDGGLADVHRICKCSTGTNLCASSEGATCGSATLTSAPMREICANLSDTTTDTTDFGVRIFLDTSLFALIVVSLFEL